MNPTLIHAAYLLAAILFIVGIKQLSSPKAARNGNLLAAVGMGIALIATLLDPAIDPRRLLLIFAAMALGTAVGAVSARRVAMTDMPQMVALFNGSGGGAAAAVSTLELFHLFRTEPAIPGVQGVSIVLGLGAQGVLNKILLVVAIAFGTINVVGGFLVTDRMLSMFKAKRPNRTE